MCIVSLRVVGTKSQNIFNGNSIICKMSICGNLPPTCRHLSLVPKLVANLASIRALSLKLQCTSLHIIHNNITHKNAKWLLAIFTMDYSTIYIQGKHIILFSSSNIAMLKGQRPFPKGIHSNPHSTVCRDFISDQQHQIKATMSSTSLSAYKRKKHSLFVNIKFIPFKQYAGIRVDQNDCATLMDKWEN